MDEYPKNWEVISVDTVASLTTYRLRVPGGFLVMIFDTLVRQNNTSQIVFVAEPNHNWTVES